MIAQRIEPTLSLMAITLVLTILVAVPLGVVAAWKAGSWIDRTIMAFAVFGFSRAGLRGRLRAGLRVRAAARMASRAGLHAAVEQASGRGCENLILPALALGCVYIALIARITRASMLEVLQQDYVRTARAKGLGQRDILFVHALKNAAVPIVTVIGIGIALLIGGAVVTESVFAIPGLGRLTVDAILRRDYPVIQGIVLLFSFVYVLVNLMVDVTLHAARSEDPLLSVSTSARHRCRRASSSRRQLPDLLPPVKIRRGVLGFLRNHPTVAIGGALLLVMRPDRRSSRPGSGPSTRPRSRRPSARACLPRDYWFGTDMLGRDIYSRVLYGARVSLTVGFSVAILASLAGLAIGLVSGFVRWADGIIMRFMDGLMSIPPILLAVALMALTRGSVGNVITRHHHRRNPARLAAGAQRRAVAARAALCGRRRRRPARERR